MPLALFTFNVGVEVGQLLFVVVVLAVGAAVRALGSVSAFWLVERVSGFWG